jgi:hypothetical protein
MPPRGGMGKPPAWIDRARRQPEGVLYSARGAVPEGTPIVPPTHASVELAATARDFAADGGAQVDPLTLFTLRNGLEIYLPAKASGVRIILASPADAEALVARTPRFHEVFELERVINSSTWAVIVPEPRAIPVAPNEACFGLNSAQTYAIRSRLYAPPQGAAWPAPLPLVLEPGDLAPLVAAMIARGGDVNLERLNQLNARAAHRVSTAASAARQRAAAAAAAAGGAAAGGAAAGGGAAGGGAAGGAAAGDDDDEE